MDDSKGKSRIVLVFGVAVLAAMTWAVSLALRRFADRQFAEGEAKPTGWVATFYAKTVPWLGDWLYAIFTKRLSAEDEMLDVACGSGALLRKHAPHVRRVAGLDHSEDLIEIAAGRSAAGSRRDRRVRGR